MVPYFRLYRAWERSVSVADIVINVIGPLRIETQAGGALALKGAKNQALLALLALSPNMTRPRRWLEDKLWSTFGPEQAGANLRQALAKIRKSLGDVADLLDADRSTVTLDASRVQVDLLEQYVPDNDRAELLQGLDVRDPEFEDWLRMERAELASRVAESRPTPATGVLIDVSSQAADFSMEHMAGDVLVNQIAENVGEQIRTWRQSVDPTDIPKDMPSSDLSISAQIVAQDGGHAIFVKALHKPSARILYSKLQQIGSLTDVIESTEVIGKTVFEAADQIIGKLPQVLDSNRPENRATALSRLGLYRMFSYERSALQEGYSLMMQAYQHDKNGIYLAWGGLIRMIQLMELSETDRDALREEAMELQFKALEHGHHNSLVQALAGKVRGTVMRDGAGLMEMAQSSVERNPAGAFAWKALAEGHFFAGDFERALATSQKARHIAASSPFRHWWDTGHCLIAIACNRPDEAIEAGEAAARAAPLSRPAHRNLLALYALKGDLDKARATADRLAKIEPGFTLDQIVNDDSYPVRTLRNTGMLEPIRALL